MLLSVGVGWQKFTQFLCFNISKYLPTRIRMPFYAVRRGKVPGVYATWKECQDQTVNFSGARYKKFATKDLASAFVSGIDNPVEGAMSSNDWTGACQQTFMELVTSFTKAATELNKYLGTLPEDLKANDAVIAGFNKAKADVLTCKTGIINLTKLLDGENITPGTSKRKLDATDEPSSKKTKHSGDVPVVYTDGSCFNNGRENPQAGIGVWWGANDKRNLSQRLPGRQTNNRAEIHIVQTWSVTVNRPLITFHWKAACEAAQQAIDLGYKKLEIRTDSQFMIDSMTKWIAGWKSRSWQLSAGGPVKNKEDFQRLDELSSSIEIIWTHVKGHSGIEGNEHADSLANAGARQSLQ